MSMNIHMVDYCTYEDSDVKHSKVGFSLSHGNMQEFIMGGAKPLI